MKSCSLDDLKDIPTPMLETELIRRREAEKSARAEYDKSREVEVVCPSCNAQQGPCAMCAMCDTTGKLIAKKA